MSGTPFDDILKGEATEEPPGPTEEARRKREERLCAIQVEIENQRRAERIAKGEIHECEQMDQWYKVERSELYEGWRLEDECEVCVTISFCPFCGKELK
jgi:hypothetical protein